MRAADHVTMPWTFLCKGLSPGEDVGWATISWRRPAVAASVMRAAMAYRYRGRSAQVRGATANDRTNRTYNGWAISNAADSA